MCFHEILWKYCVYSKKIDTDSIEICVSFFVEVSEFIFYLYLIPSGNKKIQH